MLEFHLTLNNLTPAPYDYMAQTVNVRSYTNEQIAELMLKRGSLLTKADTLAVLEVYREVIVDLVADGCAITSPLFNVAPSISGVFDGAADTYDATRHKTRINIHAGLALREAVKRIKPTKVQVPEPIPYITEVKDVSSGTVNEVLTPGGIVQLRGSRLKFLADVDTNGIFLLPEGGGGETKLTVVAENKPGRLMAQIPVDQAKGTYYLEVRSNFSGGNTQPSKQLKVGRFAKTLTI
jgi:hypothetical protein